MGIARIKPRIWRPGINRQDLMARGLLSYWSLWDSGGSRVADLVNRKHGTISGASWIGDSGLDFNGGTNQVDMPADTLSGTITQLTVAIRAKIDVVEQAALCGKGTLTTFTIGCWDGTGAARMYIDGGSDRYEAAAFFVAGEWANMVFVYDGTAGLGARIRMYKNGIDAEAALVGEVATSFTDDALELLSLGYDPDAVPTFGWGQWDGQISTCGIWDRVLSGSEIRTLHEDPYRLITPPRRGALIGAAPPAPPSGGPFPHFIRRSNALTGGMIGSRL